MVTFFKNRAFVAQEGKGTREGASGSKRLNNPGLSGFSAQKWAQRSHKPGHLRQKSGTW